MINNFVKWLSNLRKSTASKLSIYKALLYLCDQIKIDNFINIYNPIYSLVIINTSYSTINEYTNSLKAFISKTTNDEYIPVYSVTTEVNYKSLREWFIVNDSYTDSKQVMQAFLTVVKEFIEIYEHYENKSDKTYNQNKNINTFRPIINNLFILLEELKNV